VDLQAEADLEAKRLDDAYPQELIRVYVNNGGWAST
jgi:hypothetical protein